MKGTSFLFFQVITNLKIELLIQNEYKNTLVISRDQKGRKNPNSLFSLQYTLQENHY